MLVNDQTLAIEDYPEDAESGTNRELSREEEDIFLRNATGDLPDWVANLVRRVILLLENLPDEGINGAVDGTTEGLVVFVFSFFISRLILI
jgi:proteasome activator subunit 4